MASAEIRYRYDEELASRATRRLLARRARHVPLLVAINLLVAILFALQGTYWIVSALGVLALVFATLLVRYRSNAKKLARALGRPEVAVRADGEGLTFTMPTQQSTSAWSATRVLWQFDDVWLFFPYGTNATYTALPTAAMTSEFREIVLTNMRANGATVR